jgi:hypothetical protein
MGLHGNALCERNPLIDGAQKSTKWRLHEAARKKNSPQNSSQQKAGST